MSWLCVNPCDDTNSLSCTDHWMAQTWWKRRRLVRALKDTIGQRYEKVAGHGYERDAADRYERYAGYVWQNTVSRSFWHYSTVVHWRVNGGMWKDVQFKFVPVHQTQYLFTRYKWHTISIKGSAIRLGCLLTLQRLHTMLFFIDLIQLLLLAILFFTDLI